MKPPEYYRGREQTYLKHFFLERYLEKVAYNIGSFADEFVYVDGFSGPWRAKGDVYEDTSFVIAIEKLREVREGLAKVNRRLHIGCVFVEKDPTAFEEMQRAVAGVKDMNVKPLKGEFEQLIPDVLRHVGRRFALVFIDPTGWTGFGLKQITPILKHQPGEVIINFMFNQINRFLCVPRARVSSTFGELLGGPGWEAAVDDPSDREAAIIELYKERVRSAGGFKHVTSTRILKPTDDRAYFHLVYGTRHPKGLVEFRGIEKKMIEEQERVRYSAKQARRIVRSGQGELFTSDVVGKGPRSFEAERVARMQSADERLKEMLREAGEVLYEDVLGALLELPLVWESDVKEMIVSMRAKGAVEIKGLKPRERTPKPGHTIVWAHRRE